MEIDIEINLHQWECSIGLKVIQFLDDLINLMCLCQATCATNELIMSTSTITIRLFKYPYLLEILYKISMVSLPPTSNRNEVNFRS